MSHAASIRALVLAVSLVIVSAAPAQAGTIVFDFEDGLQGWFLEGSARRVQTQLLGGEWAIFGDAFTPESAFMILVGDFSPISLANVERITVDAFVITPSPAGVAEPLTFLPPPNAPPPGLVFVTWESLSPGPDFTQHLVAFIDNITFHTIPEPNLLLLLALGGVVAATHRARERKAA